MWPLSTVDVALRAGLGGHFGTVNTGISRMFVAHAIHVLLYVS
jgi:hypothetical protein